VLANMKDGEIFTGESDDTYAMLGGKTWQRRGVGHQQVEPRGEGGRGSTNVDGGGTQNKRQKNTTGEKGQKGGATEVWDETRRKRKMGKGTPTTIWAHNRKKRGSVGRGHGGGDQRGMLCIARQKIKKSRSTLITTKKCLT